ncbi:MAG: RHS repeat protein [Candidatus Hydrogenedentes bacterium]|nr:RHS repeat protein [Candidatus Hydrogenedentota bacterium]
MLRAIPDRRFGSPFDDVTVAYASDGLLDSVTDGLGHTTTYDHDGAFRLTAITDAVSKVVKYFYDSYGRMTKVGAGSTGTFDPTEYFFSATTGLMTEVTYTSGANTYDANYYYDGLARVTKITDWIDGTNGLRYGYDDVTPAA